jgi:hypothetical protein
MPVQLPIVTMGKDVGAVLVLVVVVARVGVVGFGVDVVVAAVTVCV